MKKKRLHLILIIFSLTVLFTMTLVFIGCSLDQQLWDAREETERKAAEQEVKEDQKEEIRSWEEDEESIGEDESTGAEDAEEENTFPNEPVTYEGNIENGYPITAILIVDFKTTDVIGSLSCCGEGVNTYVDANITDGKIKLDTLEITTNYSGVAGSKAVEGSEGTELPISGTITGIITDDLITFNGEMKSEEGAQKFTATRK